MGALVLVSSSMNENSRGNTLKGEDQQLRNENLLGKPKSTVIQPKIKREAEKTRENEGRKKKKTRKNKTRENEGRMKKKTRKNKTRENEGRKKKKTRKNKKEKMKTGVKKEKEEQV